MRISSSFMGCGAVVLLVVCLFSIRKSRQAIDINKLVYRYLESILLRTITKLCKEKENWTKNLLALWCMSIVVVACKYRSKTITHEDHGGTREELYANYQPIREKLLSRSERARIMSWPCPNAVFFYFDINISFDIVFQSKQVDLHSISTWLTIKTWR